METSPFSNTFVVVLAVVSCFLCANAQVNFLNQSCYEEEGTYDIFRASNFPTNRDEALDHLASLASSSYFNTNTTGSGPSKIYALFQCRYDVSPQVCQQCVAAAAKQKIWCLFNVEAIIFYQECTLHYANHSIFGIREDLPMLSVYRTVNVTDVSEFSTVLTTAITSLINNVILGFPSSSRYFATKDVDYKSNTISTLAQCNPDITASDCKGCLQSAFGNFTLNYTGSGVGQMYGPTCTLTYRLSSLDDTVPDSPFNFPSPDDGVPEAPPFNFPSPDDNVPGSPPFNFPSGDAPNTPLIFPSDAKATRSSMLGSFMASFFIVILSLVLSI